MSRVEIERRYARLFVRDPDSDCAGRKLDSLDPDLDKDSGLSRVSSLIVSLERKPAVDAMLEKDLDPAAASLDEYDNRGREKDLRIVGRDRESVGDDSVADDGRRDDLRGAPADRRKERIRLLRERGRAERAPRVWTRSRKLFERRIRDEVVDEREIILDLYAVNESEISLRDRRLDKPELGCVGVETKGDDVSRRQTVESGGLDELSRLGRRDYLERGRQRRNGYEVVDKVSDEMIVLKDRRLDDCKGRRRRSRRDRPSGFA